MKARTICCKALIDVTKGAKARIKGEQYLVCNETCRSFAEKANKTQLKDLLM